MLSRAQEGTSRVLSPPQRCTGSLRPTPCREIGEGHLTGAPALEVKVSGRTSETSFTNFAAWSGT
eukprot:1180240-Prorocentrum_minimum.AAC.2